VRARIYPVHTEAVVQGASVRPEQGKQKSRSANAFSRSGRPSSPMAHERACSTIPKVVAFASRSLYCLFRPSPDSVINVFSHFVPGERVVLYMFCYGMSRGTATCVPPS